MSGGALEGKKAVGAAIAFLATFVAAFVWLASVLLEVKTDIAVIKKSIEISDRDRAKLEKLIDDVQEIKYGLSEERSRLSNHISTERKQR